MLINTSVILLVERLEASNDVAYKDREQEKIDEQYIFSLLTLLLWHSATSYLSSGPASAVTEVPNAIPLLFGGSRNVQFIVEDELPAGLRIIVMLMLSRCMTSSEPQYPKTSLI